VTEQRRGRGRRDNGLDAPLWAPLRDVDPRVGEHLLDVLREAGIAAYLEPSADVGPYTRTVFLPSPPSDRLFVDRGRRTEARTLVDQHGDEHARRPAPSPLDPALGLDEDAEWARIVAGYDAEAAEPEPRAGAGTDARRAAAEARPPEPPSAPPPPPPVVSAPAPPPPAPDPLDVEEHFEPPPAPPLRAPAPASLYAVLLVLVGALLVGAPSVIGLSGDVGIVLGSAAVVGGVAVLVSRMRDRSTDDGDDGAVV
jgi:hypothetical protein